MRVASLLAVCLFVSACSRQVESELVGIRYEPPSGMKYLGEAKGPPPVVAFEDGLEIRAFEAPLPKVDGGLDALLAKVQESLGNSAEQAVVSARAGTLPAGKVVRWELDGGRTRTLLYLVDGGERHLVLTLTAPSASFDKRANRVERTLSTLQLTR